MNKTLPAKLWLVIATLFLLVAGCDSPTEPEDPSYTLSPTGAWSDGDYYLVVDQKWALFEAPHCEAASLKRPYIDRHRRFEVATTFGRYTYPEAPQERATISGEFSGNGVVVRLVTASGRVVGPIQLQPTTESHAPCPSL